MTISVNIIACNEEARLRWCVEHIKPYVDEVVVVVQRSDDHTLDIARELADVVVEHPRAGFCEWSRPGAVAASKGDWILALDADERLTDYGKLHLRSWTAAAPDFYYLRRLTTVDGRTLEDMPHGRLFRRSKAHIPTEIHTCYEPGRCVAAVIKGCVVIEHYKTTVEQNADDRRYRGL